MRIMIDTNVLISSFIFGTPTVVSTLLTASSHGNTLLLSTFVIEETRAVIARKWPNHQESLERFLEHLSYETVNTPANPQTSLFAIRDPNDYPVLYSAIVGKADIFVTGDKDFEHVHAEGITILTPAAFIGIFNHPSSIP